MDNARERTLAEKIGTWVQIIGIVGAAGWGAYTFIYKEITLPHSAPINVSVNLELKKVGVTTSSIRGRSPSMIAVEMQVSMKNPSSRKVDLLPSVWIAFGYRLAAAKFVSTDSFATIAKMALKAPLGSADRGITIRSVDILSTGRLFIDTWLKPNESVTRTHILHIPADTYDVLEVICEFPSAADASKLDVEWSINSQGELVQSCYKRDKSGQRKILNDDEMETLSHPPVELQSSCSVSQLSLR